jgi:hypothetical protein
MATFWALCGELNLMIVTRLKKKFEGIPELFTSSILIVYLFHVKKYVIGVLVLLIKIMFFVKP